MQIDSTKVLGDILQNLAWNLTYLAEPVKNGVVFNYDPEAPVLDKRGKPTGKTYGKLTTTILFSDGTKCSCSNSVHDKVNSVLVSEYNGVKLPVPILTADETAKEFGITQCLFKRCIGSINKDGTINGRGGAKWLKDQITKNSYDQKLMEVYGAALKKLQAEQNKERHAKAAKKAHDRKVKRLAKQMALKKEAEELLAAKKVAKTASAKPLCETKITVKPAVKKTCKKDSDECGCTMTASDFFKAPYVRPNKRFSEFTQAERREYWRAAKKGLL